MSGTAASVSLGIGTVLGFADSLIAMELGRVFGDKILSSRTNFSSESNKKIGLASAVLLWNIGIDLVDNYVAHGSPLLLTGIKVGSVAAQLMIAAKLGSDPQSGDPDQITLNRVIEMGLAFLPGPLVATTLHFNRIPFAASVAAAATCVYKTAKVPVPQVVRPHAE